MKKVFLLLTIFFLSFSNVKSQEYPNSWKMDILCKQGKNEWYESSYVVNVKNNKFQLGPYDNKHWKRKNNKWVGEIKGNKISVKETFQATWGSVSIDFKGEFINENEAIPYFSSNFFKRPITRYAVFEALFVRHRAKFTINTVSPGMVTTTEVVSVPSFTGHEAIATMLANIEKPLNLATRSSGHQNLLTLEVKHEEITRRPHITDQAGNQPGGAPDVSPLGVDHGRVDVSILREILDVSRDR